MASDNPKPEGAGEPGRPREIRLRPVMDDAVAEGAYSNLATIISGPAEFFIDFGRVVPGKSEFRIFSRVILTPAHAKQLSAALAENIRRYEAAHGAIPGLPEPTPGTRDGSAH